MDKWPPSQLEVVTVLIATLDRERGHRYVIETEPDTKERERPAIDYVLRDTVTGKRVAVEVSSIWREREAGMQDAYFDKWFDQVRTVVRGNVDGTFYVIMPIRVPKGADPARFGTELVAVINANMAALVAARGAGRNLPFTISGIDIRLSSGRRDGSDIEYARESPDLPSFRCVPVGVLTRKLQS